MKATGANYGPNKPVIGKIPTSGPLGQKQAGMSEKTTTAQLEAEAQASGDNDRKYMSSKVMTANPLELILIMYEQFFELIPDIKSGMEKHSAVSIEPDTERAQAIIDELIGALDFNVEMSKDLGAIYFYVRDRIMEGNIKLDPAIWDHIEVTMRPLYEGFKEAAKQLENTSQADSINSNSSQIIAGMTYGQNNLKEVVINTRNGIKA